MSTDGCAYRCGRCMICYYESADSTQMMANKKIMKKVKRTAAEYDDDDPPPEAAAFMACASVAAIVLISAFLAIVVSTMVLWAFNAVMPMAHAAASDRPQAASYLPEWRRQQQLRERNPHQWRLEQQQHRHQQQTFLRRYDGTDTRVTTRQKRQLFNRKANSEPGILSLTFSLIGGTISDARQAYRNVSNIVRDTIGETANIPEQSVTAAADGDLLTAGNTVITDGPAAVTGPPIEQNTAGQTLGSLLGRNYRGLRRLFNSELRSAIKNSPANVRDFTVELIGSVGQSLRPRNMFTRGPLNGTSTNAL